LDEFESWKNSNIGRNLLILVTILPSSPQSQNESGFEVIKRILKQSGPLFSRNFGSILLFILFFNLICSIGLMILLPNSDWALLVIRPNVQALADRIAANPGYELTSADQALRLQQLSLFYTSLITKYAFQFITPVALLFGSTGKLYASLSLSKQSKPTWIQSFKLPFKNGKAILTSIFLFLFLIFLIPIGLIFLYIPGIMIMIFFFFSIHSLILDDKIGLEVFRGGIFYAKDNVVKLMVLLLIGVFLPIGLSILLQNSVLPAIFGVDSNYENWIDPTNRNYGMIFVYFFVENFLNNIAFIWLPTLWVSAFYEIKQQKLKILAKKTIPSPILGNVRTMEISADQKFYHCSNCGQKLELSAKKCHQCGQLYRLVVKRVSNK